MATKAELRDQLKAIRESIGSGAAANKSTRIVAGVQVILQKLSYSGLHCYEPIESLHEVDVTPLLKDAAYTSRQIAGEWRVVSVINGAVVPEPAIDVVIVPMLGFDKTLNRIGYGGGYYDKLLAQFPKAVTIGVCYESGRVERIPVESYDVPVNILVTEQSALIAV